MEVVSKAEDPVQSRADKWTQGVMDLIKLTQAGKLQWKRLADPTTISGNAYVASLSGATLTLQTSSFWENAFAPGFFSEINKGNERSNPSLRVTNLKELVTAFPDIAALRGLAEAVEAQVGAKDESFLQFIRQAAS